ncbi:aminoacyl--tRNA ligase-related protein [Devosia nitrariae]|uniref:Proline--tRNA ligase n=1 Tax=Devosia nitrariae TaxID=2071872 RepID=A0ABQ5WAT4_9HYPH|nr:aminoacyl--tRNA ligase-related protein [Devosia nitrariae]GLQ57186.1 proline--tRNA ligase [Devosia nitrariae]
MIKHALTVTRSDDFAAWYQQVITEAELAEESGVRGCMIIRPWGMGIWERFQRLLDDRIKALGHDNAYFPLFIPISYFAKEAEHVEGFAKEMAVVTHHRLKAVDGALRPDPDAELAEPLVVRPTSETVIGAAFNRWIKSWRDLPVRINQWSNVVRWEMRTRMFLRTSEFLWQEGHAAYATADEARRATLEALELYREFAQQCAAMPVIAGEKPENERFPGAVSTFSIEAMMQDGKALQAGTSHLLGTNFAAAQDIRYQNEDSQFELAHTISWGMSTRMIGGLIMIHGDDDGLRVPPRVAPWQVVIVPMLRGTPEGADLLAYCDELQAALVRQTAFGEPLRAFIDRRAMKTATKRWSWIKKGAPIVVEIGARDLAARKVTFIRRDRLYGEDGQPSNASLDIDSFAGQAGMTLDELQQGLFDEASERLERGIRRDISDLGALKEHFEGTKHPGWVEVEWARPTGADLEQIVGQLKALKLTLRNVSMNAAPATGKCIFTGEPAAERILVARAY